MVFKTVFKIYTSGFPGYRELGRQRTHRIPVGAVGRRQLPAPLAGEFMPSPPWNKI